MTKSQQVGKNAHKKEMERVRKDSDAKDKQIAAMTKSTSLYLWKKTPIRKKWKGF